MEKGRQKDKLLVFEAQAACPLGNAAFAHDNHLATGTEGFADNVPFFQCGQHGFLYSLASPRGQAAPYAGIPS